MSAAQKSSQTVNRNRAPFDIRCATISPKMQTIPAKNGTFASPRFQLRKGAGLTQMTLVEHALCPLDASQSLTASFVHQSAHYYTDRNRNRKQAHAKIFCPRGLSPSDEFFLWGLLALTLSQPNAVPELCATPHYCLRQLGTIAPDSKGSRNYELFRQAIARLAAVHYQNDRFYDPIRGEHRQVAFGFFSYSLPLTTDSARAWRFVWDPLFFEICKASGGALSFDLSTYRDLDVASRRLYLLLKKIFWRHDVTPDFDVRHLCVNVLGFAPQLDTAVLKRKLVRVMDVLTSRGILAVQPADEPLFRKLGVGAYRIRFHRGQHEESTEQSNDITDSPLYEQLSSIGFEKSAIQRLVTTYDHRLIGEWIDITLAAQERNGKKFFTTSPQAYFVDNIKHAASGTRTPPDWWRELRVAEERRKRVDGITSDQQDADRAFEEYLAREARETFEQVTKKFFEHLRSTGANESDAHARAAHMARLNLRSRFRRDHPEVAAD